MIKLSDYYNRFLQDFIWHIQHAKAAAINNDNVIFDSVIEEHVLFDIFQQKDGQLNKKSRIEIALELQFHKLGGIQDYNRS